jgi:hypothetical protein
MPSHKRKPSACNDTDCQNAYSKFVKLTETTCCKKKNIGGLECWFIDQGKNVSGGQYKIKYLENGKTLYFKPKLHRMWFYNSPEAINMAENHDDYTVSHLCHQSNCCNPAHLALEDLATNKSRNVCPGKVSCNHKPKCIRKGPELDEDTNIMAWNTELKSMVKVSKTNLEV